MLLFAARISVEMTAPMPCHALRLKLDAAQASTGKMVGQRLPMQLIPAPCRISTPQEYGGIPSRAWGYPIVILQYSSTTLCQVFYHMQ